MSQDLDMIKCIENGIKDVIWIDEKEAVRIMMNKNEYYRKRVIRNHDKWESYFFFRNKELKNYFIGLLNPIIAKATVEIAKQIEDLVIKIK